MSLWREVVVFVAALTAGAMNSIAGAGTLISFPTLLWIGRDPIIANATNTVALWPASVAGMMAFRRELARSKRWLLMLVIPSFAGGATGAVLLIHTSSQTFALVVPYLILGATILLAAQEVITRKMRVVAITEGSHESATWRVGAFVFQFFVGIYGGYFGAGMGILMLAALGLIGLTDMHQMNGLKNLLALVVNGIAALYFIASGKIVWVDVALMAVASVIGGYFSARLARRLGQRFVRAFVVVIGLVMTVSLFLKSHH
jgi:uncharacterized membrane protein YfcA